MFFHDSAVVAGVEDGEGVVGEGDHVASQLEVEGVEGGGDGFGWGCGESAFWEEAG